MWVAPLRLSNHFQDHGRVSVSRIDDHDIHASIDQAFETSQSLIAYTGGSCA